MGNLGKEGGAQAPTTRMLPRSRFPRLFSMKRREAL
jgi:hypothetical protein